MHPVAVFDLVTFLGSFTALALLFTGWKRALHRDAKLLLTAVFTFLMFYGACLFLEWSGITKALDTVEDLIGALLPMWTAFVFYAFLQEISAHDLRLSEDRLRRIMDSVEAGIVIIDPRDHVIVDVNPAAANMIGSSKDHIIGKVCHTYICPAKEGACPVTDLGQKMDKSERLLVTADGRTMPILKTVGTVSLGGRTHLLESLMDITELKQAEDAIRTSEEKYRSLVESTEDSVYLVDVHGTYLFMNEKHLSRFGLSQDKVVGRTYAEFHSEEETKAFAEKIKEVTETGKSVWHEYTSQRDGRIFLRTLSPVRAVDGKIIAVTVVSKDITERKSVEAQLQQAQRLESVGTLAGGIAHDFNNLLMGIQGHISLMLLDADDADPHYERLRTIEKQIESGARLTSLLLGYARKGKYEMKPLSLNQLVEETCYTFSRTRKEITTHQQLSDEVYAVDADVGQIEQVLLNLFVNAAEAMPAGGEITIKTMNITHEDMTGKLYKPKPGNYIRLTVTDTGSGMDKETMERIFEPFFTTKEMGSGTGFGLASAYGIIKGHGGYIDVESKKGQGTTFSIYLPGSKKTVPKTVTPAAPIVKGTETVLLVDDEEAVRQVGRELLEAMGYRVLSAMDGKEALEIYEKQRDDIDIVLLDIVMPNMGGGEAFDRMKEIDPEIKVLLLSGYSMDDGAIEILDRGCDGFIQKPFNIKELSGKIRQVLETAS